MYANSCTGSAESVRAGPFPAGIGLCRQLSTHGRTPRRNPLTCGVDVSLDVHRRAPRVAQPTGLTPCDVARVPEPASNCSDVDSAGEHDGGSKVAQVMEPDSLHSELVTKVGK